MVSIQDGIPVSQSSMCGNKSIEPPRYSYRDKMPQKM